VVALSRIVSVAGRVAVLALVGVLAGALVAGPAESAGPRTRAVITFDKNWSDPASSRLVWQRQLGTAKGWKTVETRSWRAGSGMLGKRGKNSCTRNVGWLPNGRYGVTLHRNYPGNLIKGTALRLDNKRCGNGTVRQNLFIHTETGAGNRQCPNRRGDQACRWEYPSYNDYRSAGCIKLAPAALGELDRLFRRHFAAGVRHPTTRVVVRVVS
jgi:hypothetical protein